MDPVRSDSPLRPRIRYGLWLAGERGREWRRGLQSGRGIRAVLMYLPGPGPLLMSWLRKRWVLFRNPHATIVFEGPVYLGPGFSLDMPRGGTFMVGPGVEFRRGFRAEFHDADSRLSIGSGSAFTYDVVIQCGTTIEIGSDCVFAQAVMVVDGSHRFRALDRPMLQQGFDMRPLVISDHVAVMAKATVIANIGERSFIGANAVVSRDIPPYCLAVGTPARPIDYFGPPGGEPEKLSPRSAKAEAPGSSTVSPPSAS